MILCLRESFIEEIIRGKSVEFTFVVAVCVRLFDIMTVLLNNLY